MRTTLLGYSYTPVRQKQNKKSNYNDKNTTQQSITFCGKPQEPKLDKLVKAFGKACMALGDKSIEVFEKHPKGIKRVEAGIVGFLLGGISSTLCDTVKSGISKDVKRVIFEEKVISDIAEKYKKAPEVHVALENFNKDLNRYKKLGERVNVLNSVSSMITGREIEETGQNDFKKAIKEISKYLPQKDIANIEELDRLNQKFEDDDLGFYYSVLKNTKGLDTKMFPDIKQIEPPKS